MNRPSERNVTRGSEKAADQLQKTGSTNSSTTFSKVDHKIDAKPAVPAISTKNAEKDLVKEPFTDIAAKETSSSPLSAAKGDDDVMSEPQLTKSSTDELKDLWKQQVSAAKTAWAKLTDDELLHIEGHAHKLIDLVQTRYVVTREEADKQVKSFFEKHMPTMPSMDVLKGNWKQQIGAAKIAWGKLTEDELLKTEGQEMRLAGLVQARYAIKRDEAEKQVKTFLDQNKS
jgi:uncharacterized protein YjbJ (UPF0337 family)